jgi:hypothetical protein
MAKDAEAEDSKITEERGPVYVERSNGSEPMELYPEEEGKPGWCAYAFVNNYRSLWSRNTAFSVLSINAVIGFFVLNGVFAFFSVNAIFSIFSINSVFCIASVNSLLAIGCNGKTMSICV